MKKLFFIGLFVLFVAVSSVTSCSNTTAVNGPDTSLRSSAELTPQDFLMSTSQITAELSAIRTELLAEQLPLSWSNYHDKFFAYHLPIGGAPSTYPVPFAWNAEWGDNGSWPFQITDYLYGLNRYIVGTSWYSQ